MPDPISIAPYTALQQPDPMKAYTSIGSMMSTLTDVQLKQRVLQGQMQQADIIKQATDANGVYHPDQAQKLIQTGKYPYVAGDVTKFNLDAQNQQAVIQRSQADAAAAKTNLLAKMVLPFASGTGMTDDVRRRGMTDVGSYAVESGFWTPEQQLAWNKKIHAATPDQLNQLAIQMVTQGQPPEAATETTGIPQQGGGTLTVQKSAVPAAFPPSPGAPAGGPPAAGNASGYQNRSPWQLAGDEDLSKDMTSLGNVKQRIANLREIVATKGDVNLGPAAGELYTIKGLYQQAVKGVGLDTTPPASLSAFNELQKAVTQYARNSGGDTDYDRMQSVLGNPSTKMDDVSLGMVSKLALGVEEGSLKLMTMANLARANNPAGFDYRAFKAQFQDAYDPRVMATMSMTPAEVKLMMTRMANDPDARADFVASASKMVKMGIVGPGIIQRIKSALTPVGAQ